MKAGNRALASALIRVVVYIDALNFYYGVLLGSRWKWLDLEKWCEAILPNPDRERLAAVHYCTSLVGGRDQFAVQRQVVYLKALRARGFWDARSPLEKRQLALPATLSDLAKSGGLQIHHGRHEKAHAWGHLPNEDARRKFNTWREKQTDVNLAARMVADAAQNRFDLAILVTNDSDYVGACRVVREEFRKDMLLFPPAPPLNPAGAVTGGERRKVRELVESVGGMANVRDILPESLAGSQFPETIPGTKIHRPESW